MTTTLNSAPEHRSPLRYLTYGWWGLLCVALLASRVVYVRDVAVGNMILQASILALVITFCVFSLRRSIWPWGIRLLPSLSAMLFLGYWFSTHQLVGFDNEMLSVWEPRGIARPGKFSTDVKQELDASIAEEKHDETRDFPQFLGPDRRQSVSGVKLDRDWKAHPPREVWRVPIGKGWSGFAIVGQRAITMEQLEDNETIVCRDMKDGSILWTHSHPGVDFERQPGGRGPRSTPTIHDGRVYTLGATGILDCLNLRSGELLWTVDILDGNADLIPEWGKACSPLVVDDKIIVSAGAPGASLRAYGAPDGKPIWQAGDHFSSYCSPELCTLRGQRQIVIVNQDWVDAHDPATGEVLWSFSWPGSTGSNANTAQAFAVGRSQVFVSKHYGTGAALFNIARDDAGKWSATLDPVDGQEAWAKNVLKNKINNVSVRNGEIYGIDDVILQCVDLATGKVRWKGGRYGAGQLLLVDDLLIVQGEQGDLMLVEADPKKFVETAKLPDALHQKPCWNPPAFAPPYLVLRNWEEAVCYELQLVPEQPSE